MLLTLLILSGLLICAELLLHVSSLCFVLWEMVPSRGVELIVPRLCVAEQGIDACGP